MRASQKPPKEMILRVEHQVYDSCIECCQDNNAMFVIALNEEFGFATERLKRVISKFNDIQDRYDKMLAEGYSDEDFHKRIVEELNVAGIEEKQIYTSRKDFVLSQRKSRLREKNLQPTMREQLDAQKYIEAAKSLLDCKERYSIT